MAPSGDDGDSAPSVSPSKAIVVPPDLANYQKKREWSTFKVGEGIERGAAFWSFCITASVRPTMLCFGVAAGDEPFGDGQCVGSQSGSVGLLGDGSLWRFGKMVSPQHTPSPFECGTKIGILLDLDRGELVFSVNGKNARTQQLAAATKKGFDAAPMGPAAVSLDFAESMPMVNSAADFKTNCKAKPSGMPLSMRSSERTANERLSEGVVIGMGSVCCGFNVFQEGRRPLD